VSPSEERKIVSVLFCDLVDSTPLAGAATRRTGIATSIADPDLRSRFTPTTPL